MDFETWYTSIGRNIPYGAAKVGWDAATKIEREACAKVCEEESGIAAEMGHERFARYSAEMAGYIRMRSNDQAQGEAQGLSRLSPGATG